MEEEGFWENSEKNTFSENILIVLYAGKRGEEWKEWKEWKEWSE
jgi:hypothetical protein